MKKVLLVTIGLIISMSALAQEKEKLKTKLYADIVSNYLWRGMKQSNASIQPTLNLEYRGLSLELWGSYEVVSPAKYQEFNIILAYEIGRFTFKFQDIWVGEGRDPEARFFRYNAHSTNHVFEATICYDFGPVNVEWNTVVGGNDGFNNSGKRAYSSYCVAEVPFRLAGFDWKGTLAVVPYASTMYKTKSFAVTNVAMKVSKDIKVTDSFSIPIFLDVVANPRLEKAYMAFGFTLKP